MEKEPREWSPQADAIEHLLRRLEEHPESRELTPHRRRRMAEVACRRLSSLTVAMENVWDSHNAAAVVRTAEGLGLEAVHVVEDPHLFRCHPAILHGADRWIEIERHASVEACLTHLRDLGFTVAAADLGPECIDAAELPASGRLALVFGTEKAGLSESARTLADLRFTIPMMGFTGSFNVSVSAGMALYDAACRRRRALGSAGDLDQEAAYLKALEWMRRSTSGGRSSANP